MNHSVGLWTVVMWITELGRTIGHIGSRPMKRVLQLVILIMGVLLAAQPLLACTSCMPQGESCASSCCSEMGGMSVMPGMAGMPMSAACRSAMQTLPVESGCGQHVASIASLPRSFAAPVLHNQARLRGGAPSLGVVLLPASSIAGPGLQGATECAPGATAQRARFQILRI